MTVELLRKIFDLLMLLRDNWGFLISPERMVTCITAAEDITDMEEFFFRVQSLVCHSEEEIRKYQAAFYQWFSGEEYLSKENYKKTKAFLSGQSQKALQEKQQEEKRLNAMESQIRNIQGQIEANKHSIENAKANIKTGERNREKVQREYDNWKENSDEKARAKEIAQAKKAAKENLTEIKRFLSALEKAINETLKNAGIKKAEISSLTMISAKAWDTEVSTSEKTKGQTDDLADSIDKLGHELLERATKARMEKDFQKFEGYLAAYELVSKAKKDFSGLVKKTGKSMQAVDNVYKEEYVFEADLRKHETVVQKNQQEKERCESENQKLMEQLKANQEAQQQRQQKLEELSRAYEARKAEEDSELIRIKDGPVTEHRELFVGGKPVWMIREEAELLKKPITSMSAADRLKVLQYIRTNAKVFKNTMRRMMNKPHSRRIDLKRTMKVASRTGGEPVKVLFRQPKKSHAKVVCLVDISGSCRNASTLALYFMALMDDVFPMGCKKFAFVNTLYNVDKLFRGLDPDDAVQQVFSSIPNRGVYSDYGVPIATLEKEYAGIFTKETTFFILGDARNNKRNSQSGLFKDICQRCNRVFWLNTDKVDKWDQGDSIISEYREAGAEVSAVSTVGQLLDFLVSLSVVKKGA